MERKGGNAACECLEAGEIEGRKLVEIDTLAVNREESARRLFSDEAEPQGVGARLVRVMVLRDFH